VAGGVSGGVAGGVAVGDFATSGLVKAMAPALLISKRFITGVE
jgi:hypothetical protein